MHTSHTQHAATLEQAYASIASHSSSIACPSSPPSKEYSSARRASINNPLFHPNSPKVGSGGPSSAQPTEKINAKALDYGRSDGAQSTNLARYPSNSYKATHAPHPVRTASSSSHHNATSPVSSPVHVKHGKLPGQIWMPEGVVDMASFGPILAMDDNDPSREFTKALVWAWCDQAELAIEEMEQYLRAGDIVRLADKAHYLKGSSASLGLVKVSYTCKALYHVHFPPSLAHLRAFNYTGGGNSGLSSASHYPSPSPSSLSGNSGSLASPQTPYLSDASSSSSSSEMGRSGLSSPRVSPTDTFQEFPFNAPASEGALHTSPILSTPYSHDNWTSQNSTGAGFPFKLGRKEDAPTDFEKQKIARAQVLLERLKIDVKSSSEWLYLYYRESDKYAGIQSD